MITRLFNRHVFYSKEEKFEMYLLQIKGLFNKHVFYFKKERKMFYSKKEGKMFYSVFINKKEQNLIGSLDLSNKVFAPLN